MDFQELVHSRRSVRGFRNEAVPKAVIREIIEDAKRAPSSMNSQPWHVHVLTGEPLEQVRRRNMEEMAAGKPSKRDIFTHGPYEGAHRERQVGVAKQLFAAMGAGLAGAHLRSRRAASRARSARDARRAYEGLAPAIALTSRNSS
ncbi:MAG: nitroreductase family protein, partial [Planctomycetota bacterium]